MFNSQEETTDCAASRQPRPQTKNAFVLPEPKRVFLLHEVNKRHISKAINDVLALTPDKPRSSCASMLSKLKTPGYRYSSTSLSLLKRLEKLYLAMRMPGVTREEALQLPVRGRPKGVKNKCKAATKLRIWLDAQQILGTGPSSIRDVVSNVTGKTTTIRAVLHEKLENGTLAHVAGGLIALAQNRNTALARPISYPVGIAERIARVIQQVLAEEGMGVATQPDAPQIREGVNNQSAAADVDRYLRALPFQQKLTVRQIGKVFENKYRIDEIKAGLENLQHSGQVACYVDKIDRHRRYFLVG